LRLLDARLLRPRRLSVPRPSLLTRVILSARFQASSPSLPRWRLFVRMHVTVGPADRKGPDPFHQIGVRPLGPKSLSSRGNATII